MIQTNSLGPEQPHAYPRCDSNRQLQIHSPDKVVPRDLVHSTRRQPEGKV